MRRVSSHQSASHRSTSHQSFFNQLHQAPVNQASGDQAPINLGNLSPVSQAPINQSPVKQASGNKSLVTDTRHQSLVIQAPVIMWDYQGLDTSHRATRHQSPGTSQFTGHQCISLSCTLGSLPPRGEAASGQLAPWG